MPLFLFGVALLAFSFWVHAVDRGGVQGSPAARTVAVAGFAVAAIGMAYGGTWRRCVTILGLAAVGQACSLSLIDAPNYTVLQRSFPWQELVAGRRLFLFGELLQAAILLPMLWRKRRAIGGFLRAVLAPWKVLALAAVWMLIATNASFDLKRYASDEALMVWIMAVSLGWTVLAAAAAPADGVRALVKGVNDRIADRNWDRRLPWICAALVVVASAGICWVVFGGIPHVPDEVSYLFQAKYFAAGKLYLPAPPNAAAFEVGQVYSDGQKWFGYGFPGWPAVLAVGVLLRVPWLVNPLLAGVVVLLAHQLITRLYSRRIAHASVLLLAASPWFLFMSSNFMTHTLSLVLSLGGLLSIELQRRSRSLWWSVAGGLCLGAMVLTRPLEGVVMGTVMGLWAIGVGGERLKLAALACFASVSVLLGSVILPYNRMLTGSPLRTAQEVWTDATFYVGSDRLGFGPGIGNWGWYHLDPFPGHGLRDVLVNVHQNLYLSNFDLFGWGFGSLLFFGAALLIGRFTRADRLLLGIGFAVVAGQSFYWFGGGPDYGARYWYQILIPFIVLTVRGIEELQKRWIEHGGTRVNAQRMALFAVLASAVAVVTILPWRMDGKYHNFRNVNPTMRALAQRYRFGKALVFVAGVYPSAFVFNPRTLEAPEPIYVRNRGLEANETMRKQFPDRKAWYVEWAPGKEQYMVAAGPIPAIADGQARP